MKAIVKAAIKHFKYQKPPTDDKLTKFIKQQKTFDRQSKDQDQLIKWAISQIRTSLPTSPKPQLQRLQLHFARQPNQWLFDIFDIVLKHPIGLSYSQILSQTQTSHNRKTDIITISHYCRKLLKTNFVEIRHVRDGVIVIARIYTQGGSFQAEEREAVVEETVGMRDRFILREFSLGKNIQLNLSGMEAMEKNGMTKEEVSFKVFKQSEKKTISRMVNPEDYKSQHQRKGKIYQFKFRGDWSAVETLLEQEPKPSSSQFINDIPVLLPEIQAFLKSTYPEVDVPPGQNLLLHLVNSEIKEYTSSIGKKKEVKRQCPPSKLARYITILNYLNNRVENWANLRQLIINKEMNLNSGIMHKRTLKAILQNLQVLGLVDLEDDFVYPKWKHLDKPQLNEQFNLKRTTKPDISSQDKLKKKQKKPQNYMKITRTKQAFNLWVSLTAGNFCNAYKNLMKYAFKQLKKHRRTVQQMELQRCSLLHILEQRPISNPAQIKITGRDFQDICSSIDKNIKKLCRKEELTFENEEVVIDPSFKRYLRTHYKGKLSEVVKRYGKGCIEKLNLLKKMGWLQTYEEPTDSQFTTETISPQATYELKLPAGIYLI